MPRFERGAVVARGGRFGVVWLDNSTGLVVLPIERGAARPHDVPVDDTLPLGFAMLDARIRAARVNVAPDGQVQVGTAPSEIACRVMHAVARHYADAIAVAKWAPAEVHRRIAADNAKASR